MHRTVWILTLAAALAACSGGEDAPSRTLSRVEVTPPSATVPVGASASFHATAVYSDQTTADVTAQASWSSSAATVLSVSDEAGSKGFARALAAGAATVTATFEGSSGSASATAVSLTLAAVEVTPTSPSLPKGQELQLAATAVYEDASRYDVTASAAWTSDAEATATVSDVAGTKGRVHAVAEGAALITASFGGLAGSTSVTVTPATLESVRLEPLDAELPVGAATPLAARAVFSDGSELDVTGAASWSAQPEGIVSLGFAAGGVSATALAPGTATVTASHQGRTGTATLRVRAAALLSIQVTPASPMIPVGGSLQLIASGRYDNGQTVDVTSLATWSSGAPVVASVSNAGADRGQVRGLEIGSATITAALAGVTGSTDVLVALVSLPDAAAIRVEPDAVTVSPARSVSLRAFALSADGAQVDVTRLVTWTSSDTAVATVAAGGGTVSGVSLGSAVVTASYAAKSGAANVLVETPYPVSLLVLPDERTAISAGVGAKGALRAWALYSDHAVRDVTEAAGWGSDAPGVVTVSSAPGSKGLVECVGPGAAHVSAAFAGLSAQATFAVTPRNVQWLVLSYPPSPLPVGVTHRLTATAVYDDWTSEDVTALATWASVGPAAQVDASGVVSTLGAGSTVVTATYGGVSGSSLVAVTGFAPSGLELGLGSTSVAEGEYTWWLASLVFPDGSRVRVDDGVQLVSLTPAVADIWVSDLDPFPRGLAAGTATIEARYAGLVATQVLTVTAVTGASMILPGEIALGATVHAWFEGAAGRVDLGDEAAWSSSNGSVLTVTSTGGARDKGWVTAVGPGTATISATFGALTASRTVTVRARAMTVTVSPAIAEIEEYAAYYGGPGTQQFTATARLADGSSLDVTSVADWRTAWEVASPAYVNGLFSASNPGRTLVTASYGGAAGSAILTVVESPPVSVATSPSSATYRLPKGVTVKFTLTAKDVEGHLRTPTSGVTWTSSNPAVASFSTDPAHEGELTTTSTAGTTQITASYRGRSDGPRTVVVEEPLSIIAVPTPAPAVAPVGGSAAVQIRASYPNASGSPFTYDLARWTTWASLDPAVATGVAGRVYGWTPGLTTLGWSFAGWTGELPVTVTVPTVDGIAISLPEMSESGLFVGKRSPVLVAATLSNGDLVDVAHLVTAWTTTDAAVAGVAGAPPAAEGKAPGTAAIGATYAGKTAAKWVTVTDVPSAMLVFAPPVLSVPVGGWGYLVLQPPQGYAHVGTEAAVTISNAAVAQAVNGPYGVWVMGRSPGSSIVTATYRGQTVDALVDVYEPPGPVGMDDITGRASATRTLIHPGERASLRAEASGPTGLVGLFPGSAGVVSGATWTTSDAAIVKIVAPGLVEGVAPGVATVTATLNGATATGWVVVSGAPLQDLGKSDGALALPVGAEWPLHVYALYPDGTATMDHAATWSATDGTVLELVAGKVGVVAAKAPGTAYVEAGFGGRTVRVPVTVFVP